jgi:hypothetical protein
MNFADPARAGEVKAARFSLLFLLRLLIWPKDHDSGV